MPIYDYECLDCGKVVEIFLRSLDTDNNIKCPDCGSQNLHRLISAPATIKMDSSPSGTTCCGREERCDKPPCSSGGKCAHD